jgi:hypothetical protein
LDLAISSLQTLPAPSTRHLAISLRLGLPDRRDR